MKQVGRYTVEAARPRSPAVRATAMHTCETHRGAHASLRDRVVSSFHREGFMTNQSPRHELPRGCAPLQRSSS